MAVRSLTTRGFRNLKDETVELAAGLTLVTGDNGAGKTSLLEALCVLGNLGSFRTPSIATLHRHGGRGFELHGVVERSETLVELRVTYRPGLAEPFVYFRGARRLTAAEYLGLQPVAAFSGNDRLLVLGAPEERRRFLDRLVFHLHPDALAVMQAYRRALRQRAQLLARQAPDAELDAFDHALVSHGARLVQLRLAALLAVNRNLDLELDRLGWSLNRPVVRYHGWDGAVEATATALAQRMSAALAKARRSDRYLGHTSVGPHRHDVVLAVGGVGVREALSAGQAKLLATALKLAAVRLQQDRQAPTVVFDDVDAELDGRALERVLGRLREAGQVLVSSAHPELILAHLDGAVVWRVEAGAVMTAVGRAWSVS